MKCDRKTMLLYAVTDRAWTGEKTLLMQVEEALAGGVTCVQLREKNMPEELLLEEAESIKRLCHKYGIPFVIDDNVDLAIRCGADGVHVGQHDMEAGAVRRKIGDGMMLGVSVQTVEQAAEAEKKGADYLGVGAVFSTSTKKDAQEVSLNTLREICRTVSIPVCAIGGIHKGNMHVLQDTGIDGVALVSAIFSGSCIQEECRELRALAEMLKKKGVIFDADGTLLDSMSLWDTLGEDYLRNKGIVPGKNVKETIKNMSLPQAASYFRSACGITDGEEKIIEDINGMAASFYLNEVRLKEGVKPVLDKLKRKNVKMCVATATDKELIEKSLERNGIRDYFEGILTCMDVGAGKEEPVIFRKARELLGTPKENTLVLEDALYAIRTAKGDGFPVAAVYDPSAESDESQIREISDFYFRSFHEMENLLNEKSSYDSGF